MKKNKGTSLKFIKIKDINIIPRYLFEQIKPKELNIDRLYEWAPVFINTPFHIMGGLIDKEGEVKGVLWVSFNPVINCLTVHCLSIDKEYYGKGIMPEIRGILMKLKKNVGADSIQALTTRSNAIKKLVDGSYEKKIKIVEL